MRRHAARAKIPGPGRSRGRADPQPPDAAGPGGPAEDAASGTPATKQPDAAAVGRALRAMRDVLDGMAIPGEPSRCTLVLVDDIIPLLDRAIELLEGPPARVA